MSETPEKKQSWAKFQAKPGATNPPKVDALRRPMPLKPGPAQPSAGKALMRSLAAKPIPLPPGAGPAPVAPRTAEPLARLDSPNRPEKSDKPAKPVDPSRPAENTSAVSDELAAALNQLAKEYAAPAMTNTPFVTAMQRAEETREQKRQFRIRLAKIAAIAVAAAIALHFTVTRVLYRTPSVEALTSHVERLPAVLVPYYSSVRQPLQAGKVNFTETDRVDADRIRYAAEVTLELRKPLYIPASTNGTDIYRVLQESMELARQRDLKHDLFQVGEAPPAPELPLLIQVSHRAGETIVVRLPFEARRSGWQWRLEPPQIPLRSVNRHLVGESIEHFAHAPYLIYGSPHSLDEIRLLMRQARAYITAVVQEIQKKAGREAYVEKPVEPKPADAAPAADAGPANKPALSLEELRRLFDPNAPAVELPVPPALPPGDPKSPRKGPSP